MPSTQYTAPCREKQLVDVSVRAENEILNYCACL